MNSVPIFSWSYSNHLVKIIKAQKSIETEVKQPGPDVRHKVLRTDHLLRKEVPLSIQAKTT